MLRQPQATRGRISAGTASSTRLFLDGTMTGARGAAGPGGLTRTFLRSSDPEPHHARTKAIIRAHPEIYGYIGKNPVSALIVVTLVALQLGLAVLLAGSPWWLILIVAYG